MGKVESYSIEAIPYLSKNDVFSSFVLLSLFLRALSYTTVTAKILDPEMARTASETWFPLDDKTIEDQPYPKSDFDFTFDNADSDYVFDFGFNPDEIDDSSPAPVPEVEALRVACASGNLESVQNVFKTQWLDLPANERIEKNVFGASGLCEAIKRDDAIIASYLLCNVVSMDQYHFAKATQHKSYSFLQLYVDRG